MKLERKENESEFDLNIRQINENWKQIDKNIAEANSNLDKAEWLMKWIVIPSWSLVVALAIAKHFLK